MTQTERDMNHDPCCNAASGPPPAPPIVHYYCGGIERAVCGEHLALDAKGPKFSTRYDDATCGACLRACPAPSALTYKDDADTTEAMQSAELARLRAALSAAESRAESAERALSEARGALRRVPIVRMNGGREGASDFLTCPGCGAAGTDDCAPSCYVPAVEAALGSRALSASPAPAPHPEWEGDPAHIQMVAATAKQIDAFNLHPGQRWVIYFEDPATGARAQTFATLTHYPEIRDPLSASPDRGALADPCAPSPVASAPQGTDAGARDWETEPGTHPVRASCPKHPTVSMRACGEIARCSECGDALEFCNSIRGWKHCVREKGHPGLHVSPSGTAWPTPTDEET